MSKTIQKAIAKRILEVETQAFDELEASGLKADYRDYFWDIHDVVSIEARDNLVKMDGLVDSIFYFAVRQAYQAGLRDGMQIGDGSL